MKWFKHDSKASNDANLKRVRMKYGLEGYGLYWYCLEMIAGSVDGDNLTFELEHDAEIISFDTGIHYERVQEMMSYMVNLGLFEETQGVITCLKMAKRLDDTTSRNPEIKKIKNKLQSKPEASPNKPRSKSEDSRTRLDQIRLDKNKDQKKGARKRAPAFKKPSIEEIKEHCRRRNNEVDPEAFYNFYESKGWKVGNQKMQNWKSAIITWEKRDAKSKASKSSNKLIDESDTSWLDDDPTAEQSIGIN